MEHKPETYAPITRNPIEKPLLLHELQGFQLVGVTGFELATPASRTQCSTRLSYTPMIHEQSLVIPLNCKG